MLYFDLVNYIWKFYLKKWKVEDECQTRKVCPLQICLKLNHWNVIHTLEYLSVIVDIENDFWKDTGILAYEKRCQHVTRCSRSKLMHQVHTFSTAHLHLVNNLTSYHICTYIHMWQLIDKLVISNINVFLLFNVSLLFPSLSPSSYIVEIKY